MKIRSTSYPEKIRRIAEELHTIRHQHDIDRSIKKLLDVANELERKFQKSSRRKI